MQTIFTPARLGQYLTARASFRAWFDVIGRHLGVMATMHAVCVVWKSRLCAHLTTLLELTTQQPCAVAVQLLTRRPLAGSLCEKVLLQTEPGIRMPFFKLLPEGVLPDERRPCNCTA